MRILLVSHHVPPHGTAGTETYTSDLAQALARRGHEVGVFASFKDVRRRNLRLVRRREGAVEVREIVNNLFHARFRQTWDEAGVERAFAAVLRELRPEVVHVQHLLYLSAGCVRLAREAGARVVFTLHDYWLTCARLGQRVHADGGLCHRVDFARCGTCLPDFAWTQPRLARIAGPALAVLSEGLGLDLASRAQAWSRGRNAPQGARGDDAPAAAPAGLGSAVAAGERAAPAEAAVPPPAPPEFGEHAGIYAREAAERWRGLREAILPHVDLFLAPSRFLRERFVAEWSVPEERIELLRFGIDRARFSGARVPRPDARLRVGFLGTLVPLKGPQLLLEAWARLPAELRARARLVLRGPARHGPAFQEELLRRARAVGAEIPGPLARDEVPGFLLATDLLVVPSLWYENSPLSIQEAIACRTPLLVADLGGMAELVEPGRTGLRFRAGDAEDLARCLAQAIEGRAGLERCYADSPAIPTFDEHADAVALRYRRVRGMP